MPFSATLADLLIRIAALALAVWREARGESPLGKLLVAQTIANRVNDPRWPDSYVLVITQPAQFSSFQPTDPNAAKWPADHDPTWATCVAAACFVLQSPVPITNANHYHAIGAHPAWADPTKIVQTEGHHVFYHL